MHYTIPAPKTLSKYLLLPLMISILVTGLYLGDVFQRLEWMTFDHRMTAFAAQTPPNADIALIVIDEGSLQAMNPIVGRFPWPRSLYADLLEFLALGRPKAVVFDILFTEQEKEGAGENPHDRRLIDATGTNGPVYHAAQIFHEKADEISREQINRPLPAFVSDRFALNNITGIRHGEDNAYTLPFDGLYQAARGIGIVGLNPDADGVYRRVKLFREYQGRAYPALSIAPLLGFMPPQRIAIGNDRIGVGNISIPVDEQGDYLLKPYTGFKPYSISGIFASIQSMRSGAIEKLIVHPDEFRDKIVFVGASATGLEDVKNTAVSTKTPGVVIQASIAGNLLAKDFLQPPRPAVTIASIFLLALLANFGIFKLPRISLQILFEVTLAAAFMLWTYWSFRHNTIYDLTPPLFAIGLTWLASLSYVSFTEGRDKRKVRRMFAQYVSPAVLEEVLDKYQDHATTEIGGKERLSILFCDIRGFTGLSERLSAEQVVDLLNCYFSEMTEIIFAHHGTLDKFIGDAMMAFWGAPLRTETHAGQAVTTALEMTGHLGRINQTLRDKGYPDIGIGIGINTGEVVLGNIGSERKLDYTAIGDNVNLASRLEGLTAKYGCPILISEYTYAELRNHIPCAIVDLVRVKGKQHPIAVYRPLCTPGDTPENLSNAHHLSNQYQQAFDLYKARRWPDAMAAYAALPQDAVSAMFMARIRNHMKSPLPEDWDGVYTMDSK